MGSVGYYLRFVGGSWGTVMQTGFLFGAISLLGVILFSGTARSWLKVSISKHFFRYNYDYREEWMRFTRTLSERGPNLGERAIQALAVLVESPGGTLWQRDAGGRFTVMWRDDAPLRAEADEGERPADALDLCGTRRASPVVYGAFARFTGCLATP